MLVAPATLRRLVRARALLADTEAPLSAIASTVRLSPFHLIRQFSQGIPVLALQSSDLDADYARLSAAGAMFTKPPTAAGPVKIAMVSDTVGNLVQLYQPI